MLRREILYVVAMLIAAGEPASGGTAGPDSLMGFMEIRSQSPLQQLRYGLLHHVPWVLPAKTSSMSVRHNWKNVWLYEPDVSRIDAEVHEILLRLRVGIGRGLELTGETPMRYVSGGVLDGLIESFHKSLGIDNAMRSDFPQSQFAFEIHNGEGPDGWSRAGSEQEGWNLGNMSFDLSADLAELLSLKHQITATLSVKAPTGSRREYFGNQGVDFGLGITALVSTGDFHWYLGPGVVYYTDREMVGVMLRQWHLSGLLGLEYNTGRSNHAWTLQLLAESGIARDFYQFTTATYEVMFGYRRRLSSEISIEIGLLENVLSFDNSPDFGFHTALTLGDW